MAGLYLVGAWLLVQVAGTLLPMFGAPDWIGRSVVLLVAIGFVPALVFAWVFELTSDGLKKDAEVTAAESIAPQTAQRMNRMIVAVLVLALCYFGFDRFVLLPQRQHAMVTEATRAGVAQAKAEAKQEDTGKSIAVLPFIDLSPAHDQEYFSDGLSEELLNLLAQLPQLRVIARTSSFLFKGKNADIATIAKALNVATVLEGSVRKSGNTLRITAQLVRASDSTHIWSNTYDRELTDVFKLQDEIAGAVVAALKVKLLPNQQVTDAHRTGNTEAYEHYLIGKKFFDERRDSSYPLALAAFQRAIARDLKYARAWVGLCQAQDAISEYAASPAERDAGKRAVLASFEKAIALAPDFAGGYAARANYRYRIERNWKGAEQDFRQAMALEPGGSANLTTYARELYLLGRLTDALALVRKAIDSDPLSTQARLTEGVVLSRLDRQPEARAALQRAIDISPDAQWPRYMMGNLDLRDGKLDSALAHFQRSGAAFSQAGTAMVEYTRGHDRESRQALDELKAKYVAGFTYQIAQVYAWRGETNSTFEWLDRAYAEHDVGMTRLRGDPFFSSLKDDPRFAALIVKLGSRMNFIAELKHRKVIRRAGLGAGGGYRGTI